MPNPVNPTGMASATAAMRYWEQRQEVLSNNLANANTDGFKGERVFARAMAGTVPVVEATNDMSAGTLERTGNPLDVALSGKGFFVVQTPQGERLTRNGSFHVSSEGQLVTAEGYPVLGMEKVHLDADALSKGELTIGTNGTVSAGGTLLGRLRVDAVANATVLSHETGALFAAPVGSTQTLAPESVDVRQGYLEGSNVSTIGAMVDMITATRNYSALQKAIQTLDAARGIATSEIGKPVG